MRSLGTLLGSFLMLAHAAHRQLRSKDQRQRSNNHNAEAHHDDGDGINRAQPKHGELREPVPDPRPAKARFFLPKNGAIVVRRPQSLSALCANAPFRACRNVRSLRLYFEDFEALRHYLDFSRAALNACWRQSYSLLNSHSKPTRLARQDDTRQTFFLAVNQFKFDVERGGPLDPHAVSSLR